jgi:hypothetical protein
MEAIKGVGAVLIGLAGIAVIVLISALVINGTAAVVVYLIPAIQTAYAAAFLISLIVFMPLSAIRATRGWAAVGLLLASFVFGFTTWTYGFLVTLSHLGLWGILLGIVLGGVGVVPIGILATAFHGEWSAAGSLLFGVILTFGTRAYANWTMERDKYQSRDKMLDELLEEQRLRREANQLAGGTPRET